jgi:acetolactate synthase regulatory subunit
MEHKHIFTVLVQNQPGVLAHIAGMFAARGFNIDSLVVGRTEDPALSRMVIVTHGDDATLEQIRKQLGKIITVVKVRAGVRRARPRAGSDPLPAGTAERVAADHGDIPRQRGGRGSQRRDHSTDGPGGEGGGLRRVVPAVRNQAAFANGRDRDASIHTGRTGPRHADAEAHARPEGGAFGYGRRTGGAVAAELTRRRRYWDGEESFGARRAKVRLMA